MIGQLPFLRVWTHARAVAEALAFGPDTGVENADDDVLAFDALRPQASRLVQPEKCRRRRRIHLHISRLLDSDYARSCQDGGDLIARQRRGESVERVAIAVQLRRPNPRGDIVMARVEIPGVTDDIGICRIEFLSTRRRRRAQSGNSAGVPGCWWIDHLNDVNGSIGRCFRLWRAQRNILGAREWRGGKSEQHNGAQSLERNADAIWHRSPMGWLLWGSADSRRGPVGSQGSNACLFPSVLGAKSACDVERRLRGGRKTIRATFLRRSV